MTGPLSHHARQTLARMVTWLRSRLWPPRPTLPPPFVIEPLPVVTAPEPEPARLRHHINMGKVATMLRDKLSQ